jgi:hypothetical protein
MVVFEVGLPNSDAGVIPYDFVLAARRYRPEAGQLLNMRWDFA